MTCECARGRRKKNFPCPGISCRHSLVEPAAASALFGINSCPEQSRNPNLSACWFPPSGTAHTHSHTHEISRTRRDGALDVEKKERLQELACRLHDDAAAAVSSFFKNEGKRIRGSLSLGPGIQISHLSAAICMPCASCRGKKKHD